MPGVDLKPLRPLLWCAGAFLLGVLLHVQRVPVWASTAAVACAAWSVAAALGLVRLPGRIVKSILALGLTAAILAMFHTLNGLTAGTALLVVMGSIKLLEATARRDRYIVVAAALFLLLAACLQQQRLAFVPLYLLHAWICCCALLVVAHPRSALRPRAAALFAGRSLLYAMPLALVLFAFFPRLTGAFWAVPKPGQTITGLSDTMTPGSIAELTDSPDPAFRVWFTGQVPPPEERYWRGPVLHQFNGITWSTGLRRMAAPAPVERLGPAYHYRIRLEPSERRWLFALDTIDGMDEIDAPAGQRVSVTFDHQLLGSEPVTQQLTYQAHSHVRTRALEPLPVLEQHFDLGQPAAANPRSVALARRWRVESPDVRAFVERALELFRTGGFEYTLTPPELGVDPVDDFLFSTRQGFCGHYASAFVTLMRAGGVPARVVTGYLGGEWNPIGSYFLIRQSDAHAWAEIWLDGAGWTRIDPTAVVAPERLRRGIFDLLPNAFSAPERFLHRMPWLLAARQTWDAADAWWSERIVGFNLKSQFTLLRNLGIEAPDWTHLAALLTLGMAAWLAWGAWKFGRMPRPPAPDRVARAYIELSAKLARVGLPRAPNQGPLGYAESVRTLRPQLAPTIEPLLRRYAELRFGAPRERPGAVRAFERAVARLRLHARASRETRSPASAPASAAD
jgi:transglutaminase-like putative cysteine protease